MSGNAAVTSQEHPARTEVAYNLLDDMNCLAGSHTYTLPPLRWAHIDSEKMGTDSLGSKGGFKSLLWVPMSRGEQQMVYNTSLLK